jgi:hypothetical protein
MVGLQGLKPLDEILFECVHTLKRLVVKVFFDLAPEKRTRDFKSEVQLCNYPVGWARCESIRAPRPPSQSCLISPKTNATRLPFLAKPIMIKARLRGCSTVTNRLSDVSYVVTGASGLTIQSRPISWHTTAGRTVQMAPALPSPPGTLYTTSWGRPGVLSKSVATFSSMTNPASVTRPSIATSMPTSWPLESYTARCVAKRPADNATQVAIAAAPSPIRSVSMRVPASWASEPALYHFAFNNSDIMIIPTPSGVWHKESDHLRQVNDCSFDGSAQASRQSR